MYWSVSRPARGPPLIACSAFRSSAKFTAFRNAGLFRKSGLDVLNASIRSVSPGCEKNRERLTPYFASSPRAGLRKTGIRLVVQSASPRSISLIGSSGEAARRSTSKPSTWCGLEPP